MEILLQYLSPVATIISALLTISGVIWVNTQRSLLSKSLDCYQESMTLGNQGFLEDTFYRRYSIRMPAELILKIGEISPTLHQSYEKFRKSYFYYDEKSGNIIKGNAYTNIKVIVGALFMGIFSIFTSIMSIIFIYRLQIIINSNNPVFIKTLVFVFIMAAVIFLSYSTVYTISSVRKIFVLKDSISTSEVENFFQRKKINFIQNNL